MTATEDEIDRILEAETENLVLNAILESTNKSLALLRKDAADDAADLKREREERKALEARLAEMESRITARVDEKMAECMAKMDAMEMPDMKEPPEVDLAPVLASVAELARAVKELQTREPTPFDLIHHRNELGLLKKTEVVFKKS